VSLLELCFLVPSFLLHHVGFYEAEQLGMHAAAGD